MKLTDYPSPSVTADCVVFGITFESGGEERTVGVGESVFIPRGVTHSYRNVGDTDVAMLTIFSPAGMEGWFRETFVPVPNF